MLLAALALFFQPPAGAEPACVLRSFEGASFEVCLFDSTRHELALLRTDGGRAEPRRMSGLAGMEEIEEARVRFAMNAGIFMEDGRPLGLFVADGEESRPLSRREAGYGNFYLQPNGVFALLPDGGMRIMTTPAFAAAGLEPVIAAQSGPMLVIDGALHPRFAHDGESRRIRNGVGLLSDTEAVFVISRNAVSFGHFARFFRDGLGSEDALFLDGSISSLWRGDTGRMDTFFEIGPVFVISGRAD